jgi:hypothetical protein
MEDIMKHPVYVQGTFNTGGSIGHKNKTEVITVLNVAHVLH